jgi:hypothetical protein
MRTWKCAGAGNIALALALTITGCTKDKEDVKKKDDTPYFQHYIVAFDHERNITEAFATYRAKAPEGERIELTDGKSVKANSLPPTPNESDRMTYTWRFDGIEDVSFVLDKGDKLIYNNVSKLEVAEVGFGTNLSTSASKNEDIRFVWTGPALTQGETLTATLKKAGNTVCTKNINGTEVVFSPSELNEVTGPVTITLCRTRAVELDTDDKKAGGGITVSNTSFKNITLN